MQLWGGVDPRLGILEGSLDARNVEFPGRLSRCPECGTSAWYGPRSFGGNVPTYWLCKWCGFRWKIADGEESATMALPVYHRCNSSSLLLTWHQFEGEPYREKMWKCNCGARIGVFDSLRPFPRFSKDIHLIEVPGA